MNSTFSPKKGLSPIELIVLQGTSFCNLNCKYCDLSVESRRTKSAMEPKLIDRLFREVFESGRLAPEVTVLWHSGEPLTLPPSYYDEAIGLILRLKDMLTPDNISLKFGIQTNGVLIDDDWCRFFKRHEKRLDVGVSCDGPSDLHDLYRVNWNGRTTHLQTVRGMDLLHRHGITYKIIGVVTRKTLRQPDAFYKFFFDRREHLSGFHFNILAEGKSSDPDLAYSRDDRELYYSFYRRILELNRETHNAGHEFEILNFSQGTARIVASNRAGEPGFFEEASAPLKSLNVDAHGNVTTFYAGLSIDVLRDAYGDGKGLSLGNIFEMSLEDMARSTKLQRIMQDFALSKRACKASCEYFSVCSGGFDILKKQSLGTFEASETVECLIHVKTLVDALLDDIGDHLELRAS
ncbi:MAG: radical SAM protein [Terriglobales bacterium]